MQGSQGPKGDNQPAGGVHWIKSSLKTILGKGEIRLTEGGVGGVNMDREARCRHTQSGIYRVVHR